MADEPKEITMLLVSDELTMVIEEGGELEKHELPNKRCKNFFKEGMYKLRVFRDPNKALEYQERLYGRNSKGYQTLEKEVNKLLQNRP